MAAIIASIAPGSMSRRSSRHSKLPSLPRSIDRVGLPGFHAVPHAVAIAETMFGQSYCLLLVPALHGMLVELDLRRLGQKRIGLVDRFGRLQIDLIGQLQRIVDR